MCRETLTDCKDRKVRRIIRVLYIFRLLNLNSVIRISADPAIGSPCVLARVGQSHYYSGNGAEGRCAAVTKDEVDGTGCGWRPFDGDIVADVEYLAPGGFCDGVVGCGVSGRDELTTDRDGE